MSSSDLYKLNEKQTLKDDLKKFKIPYRNTLGLPDSITFGCEVEFSMAEYNDEYKSKLYKEKYYNTISEYMISICAPKVWKYKEEHSNQIEIISDVLKDEEISWKKLKDVLLFYIDNGAYISGKSAAHIHIGKQVLKENLNYWLNFFKLLSVFEKQIVKFSNGESYYERESFNNYSKWSSDILKKVIYNIEHSNYEEKLGAISDKSNSIRIPDQNGLIKELFMVSNRTDFDTNNTIEIRCPNGTLNKVIWQNNINFFCKMLLACSSDDFDMEYLSYLYKNLVLRNHKTKIDMELLLCDMIFTDDFDKKCFLRQYYKDFDENKDYYGKSYSKSFWE